MDTNSGSETPGPERPRRIFVAGASGYIGRHVARELVARGYQVVCLVRSRSGIAGADDPTRIQAALTGCEVRFGEVTCPVSLAREGFRGEQFDAIVCCLASRSGGIEDSWRIDYRASRQLLDAARDAGVGHFVLLSAICVQKPQLAFQQAKLRMERELIDSGIAYSIVRPTAFFKSLSGQIEAVSRGRPYLLFDREDASCKPIGEADLAAFMADCLEDPALRNCILPIGGPGPVLNARQRGELLFEVIGRQPRFRRVPVAAFDAVIPVLRVLALLFPQLADKAEFARIGRYYATESMLVLDPASGRYDADATPTFGHETLRDFYRRALEQGIADQQLGDQRLFSRKSRTS